MRVSLTMNNDLPTDPRVHGRVGMVNREKRSMKCLRNVLRTLMAVLVVALALPANAAPEKIFSVSMSPANVTAGTAVALTATIKNETPNGNSSINSFVLTAPSGYTITGVGVPPSGTAAIATAGGSCPSPTCRL